MAGLFDVVGEPVAEGEDIIGVPGHAVAEEEHESQEDADDEQEQNVVNGQEGDESETASSAFNQTSMTVYLLAGLVLLIGSM